jgi:hypothetical protein
MLRGTNTQTCQLGVYVRAVQQEQYSSSSFMFVTEFNDARHHCQ